MRKTKNKKSKNKKSNAGPAARWLPCCSGSGLLSYYGGSVHFTPFYKIYNPTPIQST
jgi:hypothetical protein